MSCIFNGSLRVLVDSGQNSWVDILVRSYSIIPRKAKFMDRNSKDGPRQNDSAGFRVFVTNDFETIPSLDNPMTWINHGLSKNNCFLVEALFIQE